MQRGPQTKTFENYYFWLLAYKDLKYLMHSFCLDESLFLDDFEYLCPSFIYPSRSVVENGDWPVILFL
jgi:hypothetical protein